MSKNILIFILVAFSALPSLAEAISFSCGSSEGYSYYFGESGFVDDEISSGKTTLTIDDEGNPGILFVDVTGKIKSVSSQGGDVRLQGASNTGANWIASYSDGTLLVYSLNTTSMKVITYLNNAGSASRAKNSLMVSDCVLD